MVAKRGIFAGLLIALALAAGPADAATLYISEFGAGVSQSGTATAPILPQPALVDQAVTFTTTTQSAAFGAHTHAVLLLCDAACSVKFGSDPTATASNLKLPANTFIAFGVSPGQKVAVVTNP